ncbi:three-Cys-motif partner protein TcmP [Maricaulis sp.]|uniref:three-Cys-motif partner protein TcmP n=1 Tax=Maricaulis sp. TaxID=1486257 RepID=UPI00262A1409|nr:three-Cys-motif partner protein TcmP [Maricaulis sp.]
MQSFGGDHTKRKLEALERYLDAFTTALSKQPLKLHYFDAFAGTGTVEISKSVVDAKRKAGQSSLIPEDDANAVIQGSATRALQTRHPFDRYNFVELDPRKIGALKDLLCGHERYDRCQFSQQDANAALLKWVGETEWSANRGIVFLDPMGGQVHWDTVDAIARTEAIDLWYLFPAFLCVDRQISRKGIVHPTAVQSLNRIFGGEHWRDQLIQREERRDLFDNPIQVNKKLSTPVKVTEIMISQMKSIFKGGVSDRWLPLGRGGSHWYSLLFACSNPSPKASKLALKLAREVLK